MSASFSFSFSGDDIENEGQPHPSPNSDATATARASVSASAFPVAGKPLLPATSHDLKQMLAKLPSKVAYGILDIDLDDKENIRLPRRELWDVRVQLMAEEEDGGETEPGLGNHDVKTGVYEGGFKSWESSVDLVRVLALSRSVLSVGDKAPRIIELGCGTALPSLALFNWALSLRASEKDYSPFSIVLADYNPTVLQLVTLPNFILTWALHQRAESPMLDAAFSSEGEFDLTPEILEAFQSFLATRSMSIRFFSGAWSPEFVELITATGGSGTGFQQSTVVLGAETIYSPFALDAFTQTVFSLLEHEKAHGNIAEALVGAKKLYFGVGGSLDDFIVQARDRGANVEQMREETEGLRRGVVRCSLPG